MDTLQVAMGGRYSNWYLSPLCLKVGFKNEVDNESRLTFIMDEWGILVFQLWFGEPPMQ